MNVFSANVKNIKSFKSLLSIIKDIMIDITLIITKEGINVTSLDETRNILVHIDLLSENFNDYICLVDKLMITTGSQNLYRIVSKISNKSTLNICIKEEDYSDFNIHFLSLNVNNTLFRIRLNENPCTEFEIPTKMEKKHKTSIKINSEDIFHVVKNMESISDNVEIHTEIDQINFNANGQYAESHVSFPCHSISIEMNKTIIPISVLKLFTKSVNLTNDVLIEYGNGIPFLLSYKINDLGNFTFYYKNCQSI